MSWRVTAITLLFGVDAFASESTNWPINNAVSMMDWGSAHAKESGQ
jgi:hypothetical protein